MAGRQKISPCGCEASALRQGDGKKANTMPDNKPVENKSVALANPYMAALWKAVKAQVGQNREHGWGQADSMAAITEILSVEIEPDAMLLEAIDHVVNPSAFRQKLEGVKRSDGQTILQKHEGKKRDRTLAAMDY